MGSPDPNAEPHSSRRWVAQRLTGVEMLIGLAALAYMLITRDRFLRAPRRRRIASTWPTAADSMAQVSLWCTRP